MTQRAHPADLRKAMEIAHEMVSAGIMFVPVPCRTPEEVAAMTAITDQRLEELAAEAAQ